MKIRSRFLIRLAGRTLSLFARTLFLLVRRDIRMEAPNISPYAPTDEQFLYCMWHDSVLCSIFGGWSLDMAALVSRHADGSYVADGIESVGLTPIRGSSNHGGAAAMKQMMKAAEKKHISIATDGPRGPRRIVKEGIIFLASQSGRAIIPIAASATRSWNPRGRWTDLHIPRPLSRLVLLGGEPIRIPPDLSREEREVWRQRLQATMEEHTRKAQRMAGHDPDTISLFVKPERQRRAA